MFFVNMDTPETALPQVVSVRTLVYQNKQLIRLVRDLRWELKSIEKCRQTSSDTAQLEALTEKLEKVECEKRALYSRLERIGELMHQKSEVRAAQVTPVQSPAPASPELDRETSVDHSIPASEEQEELRSEIVRLKAALAIAKTVSVPPSNEVTTEIELFNLNSDRNIWMAKAKKLEEQLAEVWEHIKSKIQSLDETASLTEQTYLAEVSRMAEELVQRQQEIRKCQLRIADLEQKLRFVPDTSLDAPAYGESELAKKLNDQLRGKEEQCNRLLSQHVQLQHRLTSLEQEIVMQRSQAQSSDELMTQMEDELSGIREREKASLELVDSFRGECKREQELRSRLEMDLVQARKEATKQEQLKIELSRAWDKLQVDYTECLKNLSDAKKPKLQLTSVPSSLLQMELDELKDRMKCPLCLSRFKSVALVTCMHCFCRECVDEKMLNARNRKCPLCMQRFADADVRKMI